MITFNEDDIKLVEKFIDIKNRGFYVDGAQLTATYNRILHKTVSVTNCSSCLRRRVNELETALNAFKAHLKALENTDEQTVHEEENKALTDAEKMKERMAKVRAGKKKK